MKHPIQPLIRDKEGTIRFKQNAIVTYLLDHGLIDLNKIGVLPFDDDDRSQFAQLIGYSVSGFGNLSYADPEIVKKADKKAMAILRRSKRKK